MEETERKDNRLLSGLIDLKVEHIGSDKVVEEVTFYLFRAGVNQKKAMPSEPSTMTISIKTS